MSRFICKTIVVGFLVTLATTLMLSTSAQAEAPVVPPKPYVAPSPPASDPPSLPPNEGGTCPIDARECTNDGTVVSPFYGDNYYDGYGAGTNLFMGMDPLRYLVAIMAFVTICLAGMLTILILTNKDQSPEDIT